MSINLFGTDGIRTQFGTEPLTVSSVINLGKALAQWSQKKYGNLPSIVLAHDTRQSCSLVKSALKTGLLQYPVTLFDAQVLPSPAVAALLHTKNNFDFGIIISASHNSYTDNGIKIIDSKYGKLTQEDELAISDLYINNLSTHEYNSLGCENSHTFEDEYCNYVLSFFKSDFLYGKKIILDCAQGATFRVAPRLFSALGAEVISLFDKPNGTNINSNCGSTHPGALQKAVIEHKADMGFAFDGDGDRILAVNRLGQIKDGDDILALLLAHPIYSSMNSIVGTIMTNQGLELSLHKSKKSLIRTQVGDKHVAQKLQSENLLLGGEASGHIILADYLMTGDGIFTGLRVAESIQFSHNWDMETFAKFPQIHAAIAVKEKKDLKNPPFSEIIALYSKKLHQGRLIIRYSGTEPVLRIMVEDNDFEHAQSLCTILAQELQKNLVS